jgi:hypothetical protein
MYCIFHLQVHVLLSLYYFCNVKHLSSILDSKRELNHYEDEWSKSHRSIALDEEKRKQGHKTGGYLEIWPEDMVRNLYFRKDHHKIIKFCTWIPYLFYYKFQSLYLYRPFLDMCRIRARFCVEMAYYVTDFIDFF